jgi:hypothetical protein
MSTPRLKDLKDKDPTSIINEDDLIEKKILYEIKLNESRLETVKSLQAQSYQSQSYALTRLVTSLFFKDPDPFRIPLEKLDKEFKILEAKIKEDKQKLEELIDKNYIVDCSNIDINQYPQKNLSEKPHPGTYIIVGDLHGNAMKLIYILARHQFISIDAEDYQELSLIYNQPIPDLKNPDFENQKIKFSKNLERYTEILETAIHSSDPNQIGKLLLLGDILADRGNCDIYTIKLIILLICKKDNNNLGFIKAIIASNHDNVFLLKLINNFNSWSEEDEKHFMKSMVQLEFLFKIELISKKDLLKQIEDYYLPLLKPIFYNEYYDNEGQAHIDLYTHAPTKLFKLIQEAADYYQLDLKLDGTKKTLFLMIDKINEAFFFKSHCVINRENPLDKAIWERISEGIPPDMMQFLPMTYDNSSICYSHGHDRLSTDLKQNEQTQKLSTKFLFNLLSKSALSHMTGYDNGLGSSSTHGGNYFTQIIKERKFTEVSICKKEPTLKTIQPHTISILYEDRQLTAYWYEKGKVINRSFSLDGVKNIIEMLPKTTEISYDSNLIKAITEKYIYSAEKIMSPTLQRKC